MRLVVRILGREVLAVDVEAGRDEPDEPPVDGPPFGFTGSAVLYADRAEPWPPDEVMRHGR